MVALLEEAIAIIAGFGWIRRWKTARSEERAYAQLDETWSSKTDGVTLRSR